MHSTSVHPEDPAKWSSVRKWDDAEKTATMNRTIFMQLGAGLGPVDVSLGMLDQFGPLSQISVKKRSRRGVGLRLGFVVRVPGPLRSRPRTAESFSADRSLKNEVDRLCVSSGRCRASRMSKAAF